MVALARLIVIHPPNFPSAQIVDSSNCFNYGDAISAPTAEVIDFAGPWMRGERFHRCDYIVAMNVVADLLAFVSIDTVGPVSYTHLDVYKRQVYGYKGKQVRDNIHSHDVIATMEAFATNPRPGEVYNLGGGRGNSVSVLEAIARIEDLSGRKIKWVYNDQARKGDHICYISDLHKLKSHFPGWGITRNLDDILQEMVVAEQEQASGASSRS